ncbi:MAG: endolytic transglycosylase MltG [Oscillospiraceae bacterium]|nr:endolytic transglycosylase MltG [Oscillospiraceae bacterium]
MSDNKKSWDSYFKGGSDAPDYQPADDATKAIPNNSGMSSAYDTSDTGPENFKINFDFDGEYRDVPTAKPLVRRREKRSGCVGGVLYGIFIICVSLIAAVLMWMAAVDVLALGKEDDEVILTVPEEVFYIGTVEVEDDEGNVIGEEEAKLADLDMVADLMYDSGLIKYKGLFKIFCKFCDAETKIGPGTYTLNTKYDYRALVQGTTPGSAKLVEVLITIPEGYTLKQIFSYLEEEGICTAQELWDTAANYDFDSDFEFLSGIPAKGDKYRLEGYLFPDTYYFYVGDDPVRVINKFLNNFEVKFGDIYIDRAAEIGYTIHDIVIIASMIERESSSFEGERDMIASVIYNRINSNNFPYLQIDATILYGMSRNDDEDLDLSTSYDSPYNSYTNEGLPPGPISNPGEAAIRGALYPEDSNYYFYALHKDGYHEFFKNYDSFLKFINSDNYGG